MILEALTVATSAGVMVISVLGSLAAVEIRKFAKSQRQLLVQEKERGEAQTRAANEFGRKLASGIDPGKLLGRCMDPECKEHGGTNRGK